MPMSVTASFTRNDEQEYAEEREFIFAEPIVIVFILIVIEAIVFALLVTPQSPLASTGQVFLSSPSNRFYLIVFFVCAIIIGVLLIYDRAPSLPVIIASTGFLVGIIGFNFSSSLEKIFNLLDIVPALLGILIALGALWLWLKTGFKVSELERGVSDLERDLRKIHERALDDLSKRIDEEIRRVNDIKDKTREKEERFEKVKRMVG